MAEYWRQKNKGANVKFEMCERVGLVPYKGEISVDKCAIKGTFINAEDVERVLAEGVNMTGFQDQHGVAWIMGTAPRSDADTHQGLLVNITPIKPKDTAESLLRECLDRDQIAVSQEWRDRARKVLGEK